ncbi:MAG: hypothetical protein QM726_21235 [Chitinophagaceae bacterium]
MKTNKFQNIARIILGIGMIGAAVAHFTFARNTFQAQVPDWVPLNKDLVVILSGIVELGLGLSMLILVRQKKWVGLTLAIFFLLVWPGNIAQYVNKINAFGLDTDAKRLVRLFFQPVLIGWALWCTDTLRKKSSVRLMNDLI